MPPHFSYYLLIMPLILLMGYYVLRLPGDLHLPFYYLYACSLQISSIH